MALKWLIRLDELLVPPSVKVSDLCEFLTSDQKFRDANGILFLVRGMEDPLDLDRSQQAWKVN